MKGALRTYAGAYLLFLYLPVLLLPLFSFNDAALAAFPLRGFTWRWYAALWQDRGARDALAASLSAALPASLIATVAGTLAAYALTRRRGFAAVPIATLAVAPLLIPGVVLGIALLIVARALGQAPSLPLVCAGQTVLALPICVIAMRTHFHAVPANVEDAAMDLGAPPLTMLLRVVLPMAAPALLSALVMSFTASMDEFVVSFFLVGTRQTLPLFIWDHLRFPTELPRMMALGSIMLFLSASGLLLGARLLRSDWHAQ